MKYLKTLFAIFLLMALVVACNTTGLAKTAPITSHQSDKQVSTCTNDSVNAVVSTYQVQNVARTLPVKEFTAGVTYINRGTSALKPPMYRWIKFKHYYKYNS